MLCEYLIVRPERLYPIDAVALLIVPHAASSRRTDRCQVVTEPSVKLCFQFQLVRVCGPVGTVLLEARVHLRR